MNRNRDLTDSFDDSGDRVAEAYVPPLELTEGQPPPIAANGGLSYMSFDQDGDEIYFSI